MDQHVGAARKAHQILRRRGVPRDNDRAVVGIKSLAECRHNRRMIDEGCRHFHAVIRHDSTIVANFMDVYERYERHSSFA